MVVTARCLFGFDTGVSYDSCSAVLIFRVAGIKALNPDHDGRPVFLIVPRVWPPGTLLASVADEVVSWLLNYAIATIEVQGVAAMLAQELRRRIGEKEQRGRRRWNLLHTTAESKTVGYMALLTLYERDQLIHVRDPAFLRQMRGLQMQQGARGLYRIEAQDAAIHDDIADAAMLAAAPWRPHGAKRMFSELLRYANPNAAPPEADLPAGYDGGETVELGCGLRIFKEPPLQDVDGRELWLPTKPQPAHRTNPLAIRAQIERTAQERRRSIGHKQNKT